MTREGPRAGAKGLGLHKTPLRDAVGVSLGVAAVAALLTLPVGAVIKRRILTNRDLEAGREVARRAEQMEAAAEAAARLARSFYVFSSMFWADYEQLLRAVNFF